MSLLGTFGASLRYRTDSNRYSYAGCLRHGGGGIPKDIPKAVSLFEQLGDKGLLEAKVRRSSVSASLGCTARQDNAAEEQDHNLLVIACGRYTDRPRR